MWYISGYFYKYPIIYFVRLNYLREYDYLKNTVLTLKLFTQLGVDSDVPI